MATVAEKPQTKTEKVSAEVVMQNLHDLLGVPNDYSHTKAINVFENRWRVNVYRFRRDGIPSLIRRVFIGENSFFVEVDEKGKITSKLNKPW